MTTRATKGRGLFYHRDSEAASEMVPLQYVRWAANRAKEMEVIFTGTPEKIQSMMTNNVASDGNLFLDYGISGNVMDRPGFNALCHPARTDLTVSHLFIPLRDRIARPDNPLLVVALEIELRQEGLTLVFQDGIAEPLPRGRQIGFAETIPAMASYTAAGKFRRDLAMRNLSVKVELVRMGFSIGGEPPYGFRRVLCRLDGTFVQELPRNRIVKEPRHHVAWLPDDNEMPVLKRIIDLYCTTPASRIASILNDEGIPSPNAGRFVTNKKTGIRAEVSGLWGANTIKNIVTHPLLIGVMEYGKRASGDQLRFTINGPRELRNDEYDGTRVKTITNPEETRVRQEVPGKSVPTLSRDKHAELIAIRDERGRHLKGKPRQHGIVPNPLGTRVFCLNYSWMMYRNVKRGQWAYLCGLNEATQSSHCTRNRVDGIVATQFTLSVVRQRLFTIAGVERLRQKLIALAQAEQGQDAQASQRQMYEAQLQKLEAQLKTATRNMTLAEDDDQYKAMAAVFKQLQASKTDVEQQLAKLPSEVTPTKWAEKVELALANFQHLEKLAQGSDGDHPKVTELFNSLDVKLYFRFQAYEQGRQKRMVPASGTVTFGDTPSPGPLYDGPTSRAIIRQRLKAGLPVCVLPDNVSQGEVESSAEVRESGNVQRVT